MYGTRTDVLHQNSAARGTSRDATSSCSHHWPRGTSNLAVDGSRRMTGQENTVTLTGEALVRWKYQRYMRDYLATVQARRQASGPANNSILLGTREEHHRDLYDYGLSLEITGSSTSVFHGRRITQHAVSRGRPLLKAGTR